MARICRSVNARPLETEILVSLIRRMGGICQKLFEVSLVFLYCLSDRPKMLVPFDQSDCVLTKLWTRLILWIGI